MNTVHATDNVTGVSKFTKLSIFSTLSSLNDISFEDEYAAMFGYTEEELGANFEEHLRAHAEKMGCPTRTTARR